MKIENFYENGSDRQKRLWKTLPMEFAKEFAIVHTIFHLENLTKKIEDSMSYGFDDILSLYLKQSGLTK